MSLTLTSEMSDAVRQHGGEPVTLEDNVTHSRYVLLPIEVYERIKSMFGDEAFSVVDTYAAQSTVAGAAGWDDPEMDVYDNYDSHRPKP